MQTSINRAAAEFLAGFDCPEPLEAIALRGTSEEDDLRLEEAYGEAWEAIAIRIQEICQSRVGGAS